MVSDERYYEYMGRRLREEEEKESVIKEEHTHTNGLMLDMAELTKCHYQVLKRNQELYDENQKLKKGMNCWCCGVKLIWGGDHDLEEDETHFGGHRIITNLSCPQCEAFVEVYHGKDTEE